MTPEILSDSSELFNNHIYVQYVYELKKSLVIRRVMQTVHRNVKLFI